MTASNRWPLLVGGLLFVLGIAILLVRGLAMLVPIGWLVDALGHDYLVVAFLGVVALAVALSILIVRSVEGFDQSTPPSAESVPTGRPVGADIDRAAADDLSLREHVAGTRREELRRRLRETAVRTVMRTDGCSQAAAEAAVSAGEWTDDDAAAKFLTAEGTDSFPRRLRDGLPGGSRFQKRTRAAVAAILEQDQQAVTA